MLLDRVVVAVVLGAIELLGDRAEGGDGALRGGLRPALAQGLEVLPEREVEGLGRGEEALLEELEDELGGEPLGIVLDPTAPEVAVLDQPAVGFALIGGVVDLDRAQDAGGEAALAELVLGEVALEAADHDRLEALVVDRRLALEASIVQQLEQGGEALGEAVVRSRREEELVLAVRYDGLDGLGATGVDGVVEAAGGGDVVGLVDDQEVEAAAELGPGR